MKSTGRKKTLAVDFDGVINSYKSGWQGAGVISDPPTPGAMEFLWNAHRVFEVHIISSRLSYPEGMEAVQRYIREHMGKWMESRGDGVMLHTFMADIKFSKERPPAFVTLDDRAIRFNGLWPEIWALEAFQPWHQKDHKGPPA
jgi:hypothetical protein